MRNVFVEFLVLVFGDFGARPGPDRLHRVQRFVFGLPVFFLESNRMGDEIGIPLDDS